VAHLFIVASLIFEHGYLLQPTWTTFTALLYLVVFCSCLSFFLTFWHIRRIGAMRTAYGDFIIPGVTLVLSYLLLGESLTPAKIGGFVLVMVGCALIGN
jgi:drug/metabolite transporter (DMT)-like permease